jgi:outer membrane lipoprotein SlyB
MTNYGRMLACLILLAACTPDYSPDTYASGAVQQANKVEQGIVAGRRQVGVSAQGTAGAVTGAAAGGIAGAQMPGSGVRTALSALGGSVVGGLVGAGVERATGDTTAYEYIVRKANEELVSVTQKDLQPLELGQKVLVIAGAQARIVPDYTVAAPVTARIEPVVSTPLAPAEPSPAGP